MTKRGLLIVISGPSGVGKDTILNELMRDRRDCELSVSATTRPPRKNEQDGMQYYFISREAFGALVSSGNMLEYAEYDGNYYGTPADAVRTKLSEGVNVILEIEVQGALQIRKKCPDAVFVFIAPPDTDELRRRLVDRGSECEQRVKARMEKAAEEMSHMCEYDYIIVNNTVGESCEKLSAIITAVGCSTRHMSDLSQEENAC